jgi:hypothetical protein
MFTVFLQFGEIILFLNKQMFLLFTIACGILTTLTNEFKQ